MSQNYEFKFYNPKPMLVAEQVVSMLNDFEARGGKIIDYELDHQIQKVIQGQTFDPNLAVKADGICMVGFTLSSSIGNLDVTFQTYPSENKGAQSTISVGEDVYEEAPEEIANILIDLAKIISLHLPFYFGWGDHELVLQRLEQALKFDRIGALAWANLFSLEMMRQIGQEQLRGLPFAQVQELNEGLMCTLTTTPSMTLSREQIDEIRSQLPECILPF